MDRNLAALNPRAADLWAKDKVAESIANGRPKPQVIEEYDPLVGTRAYEAMRGIGDEIQTEVDADAIRNDARGKQVWDSV